MNAFHSNKGISYQMQVHTKSWMTQHFTPFWPYNFWKEIFYWGILYLLSTLHATRTAPKTLQSCYIYFPSYGKIKRREWHHKFWNYLICKFVLNHTLSKLIFASRFTGIVSNHDFNQILLIRSSNFSYFQYL